MSKHRTHSIAFNAILPGMFVTWGGKALAYEVLAITESGLIVNSRCHPLSGNEGWNTGFSELPKDLDYFLVTGFREAPEQEEDHAAGLNIIEDTLTAIQKVLGVQEGGNHYKDQGIQPVEYIHANELTFFEGNVVKYITRHASKGGAKDLRKVIHYAEMILAMEYGETYIRDEETAA